MADIQAAVEKWSPGQWLRRHLFRPQVALWSALVVVAEWHGVLEVVGVSVTGWLMLLGIAQGLPVWLILAAIGLVAAILWPVQDRPPRRLENFYGAWTTVMLFLAALGFLAPSLPEIAPGRLALDVVEARAPMAYLRDSDGRLPAVGYVVAIQNEGDVPTRLESISVRIEPNGGGNFVLADCPRFDDAVNDQVGIGLGGTPERRLVYRTETLVTHRMDSPFEPDSVVLGILLCTIPDSALVGVLVDERTRHVVRAVDQNGNSTTGYLLWPTLSIPADLTDTRFGGLALAIIP